MADQVTEFEQAVAIALNLSPLEKVRLVEKVMATLEQDVQNNDKKPGRSLYGFWSDSNVSEQDIDDARKEMWGNFPREDI